MKALIVAMGLLLYAAPSPSQELRDSQALSCPSGYHSHELQLDDNGLPIVYQFGGTNPDLTGPKIQPDIVMDGQCHDDNSEQLQDDPNRRKLPKPEKKHEPSIVDPSPRPV